jgi:hypothetical protein
LNYIFDFKYNRYENFLIKKNIKSLNNNATFYLNIDNFKNQKQVNESSFIEIFNFLKNNNFKINTEFIRFESAYKNIICI